MDMVYIYICIQEANKMVQDAHIKRMQAEKLLKEANSKVNIDNVESQ